MTLRLLCFSIGIILVGYLPTLPSTLYLLLACFSLGTIFFIFNKKLPALFALFALVVGIIYGTASGHHLVAQHLPNELTGQDLIVEGMVVDLPQENNRRQLFTLNIHQARLVNEMMPLKYFPNKINLSSYGELRVKTGETWQLRVKLKPPRGFVNPGGFDYQTFLLRHGIGATGYIRTDENRMLQNQPSFSIDVLRYRLQQWLIQTSQSSQKGILVALLVGDTSLVDKSQWSEMIKTGTNHLIAISGLHLGFFAIVGFFIGNCIGRCIQIFWHKYPSMVSGYICSMSFTIFYSLIAGFNIPTIRTLIMLAVVQLAFLWRRNFRVRDTLLIALVLVLIYDPLAAYDMGFWLSFSAVAMLIFCFSGRYSVMRELTGNKFYVKHAAVFLKSQWVMFIGLLIPLAILVHTTSLIAPLANLMAIPVITFFVVPCLILSALTSFALDSFLGLDKFFLQCAELGISLVHQWLDYLLAMADGKFNPLVNVNSIAIFLAIPAIFLLLLPRGLGSKWIGCAALLLSLVIPLKQLPDLQMLVFDVGQGTAVLVRTPHHQLLYDTGPLYTENFDAGSGIIVPYLRSQGLESLDTLVVSHHDQDHSGGLAGVLGATEVHELLLGEPDKLTGSPATNCHEKLPWQWDSVRFSFITWPLMPTAKANNHSCVLLIEYEGQKILLTGDIEKEVEQLLLSQQSLSATDILLAPHHGSHTSSTIGFVEQVKPRYVIYSAGFNNQHGHPHKDVRARYENAGSIPLNTASGGALEFVWSVDTFGVQQYRLSHRRYWFE
ncbi:MAG: DNA internalization-related competence protein ComEC/Rec2 [Gammaproteobacteria bacterium]|nr:MAG: DNA internalization-related competence protein ComEC/Rec2 [Gammaproteobacteria bacterium]